MGVASGGSGEWTDDTKMAVILLQNAERAVADGTGLTDHLDAVVQGWVGWAAVAKDVGNQTRALLGDGVRGQQLTAAGATDAACGFHRRSGRSGGNGSLMRTAPVALAYLHDELAMAAARTISELTHTDPDAGDACVVVRRDPARGPDRRARLRRGLGLLPADRRDLWVARIEEAERSVPADFDRNRWMVQALRAAWSAITGTAVPDGADLDNQPGDDLRLALEADPRQTASWSRRQVTAQERALRRPGTAPS